MFHFSMAIMSEYKVLRTGHIYFPLHTTNSPWKVGIGAIQIYYPVIPQTLATKKRKLGVQFGFPESAKLFLGHPVL